MSTSRRSRILILAAALLLIIFIVATSHNNDLTSQILRANESFNKNIGGTVESTTKFGGVDESLIKQKEEKLKEEHGLKTAKAKAELQGNKGSKISNQDDAVAAPDKDKSVVSSASASQAKSKESSGAFDAAKELQSILSMSPVVIFSKSYCGYSKALKNLLSSEYEITPAPTIVELDMHKDGRALQDYIGEISGRKTVPNLFINGMSRGGSDDMKALHASEKLLASLKTWGGNGVSINKINAPSNS